MGNCAASKSTTERRSRASQWPFLLGKVRPPNTCRALQELSARSMSSSFQENKY